MGDFKYGVSVNIKCIQALSGNWKFNTTANTKLETTQ